MTIQTKSIRIYIRWQSFGGGLPSKRAVIHPIVSCALSFALVPCPPVISIQRSGVPRRQTALANLRVTAGATIVSLLLCAISSRSEEHTSELQSLMRISYAVFCLKTKTYTHEPSINDNIPTTTPTP